MILNKGYQANDVVSFKLTSGEEMLARYVEETDAVFYVTKPVNLVPTPQGSLGMVPAMFSAELNTAKVSLQKSAVALHAPAMKQVADEYVKGTTGIKPASSLIGVADAQGTQGRRP